MELVLADWKNEGPHHAYLLGVFNQDLVLELIA